MSGCSQGGSAVGTAAETGAAIVLQASNNQLVQIAAAIDPRLGAITFVAIVGVDVLELALKHAHAHDPADTLLVVRQTINGKAKASIFRITGTRKLRVALNGKFVEQITRHEILITVAPGSSSTIVVTDAQAAKSVYRSGAMFIADSNKLNGWLLGHRRWANLDTGQDTNVSPGNAELQADLGTELVTLHGSTAARLTGGEQPSLTTCAGLPKSRWTTSLSGYRVSAIPPGATWCLHTSHGRYAAIIITEGSGGVLAKLSGGSLFGEHFDYVVWKKSGDR
jgi:hypothetical protein